MRYYYAPLEGLTDSIYRRLHYTYFGGVDCYFTPFFSPTVHRALTPRESRELPPAGTCSYRCVPQLLTKVSEDFIWMSGVCRDLGYDQVNLNLGCPSGTVTAKGKGAGMLKDLEGLDRFLDQVYSVAPLPISVKTRLGFDDPEEFYPLLEIFNRYPIRELIIHPRIRKDFYNDPVRMPFFAYALEHSRNPVCYNGNLNTLSDIKAFQQQYPQVEAVMIGRGLIGDPGMLLPSGTQRQALEAFHNALLDEYLVAFGGSRNAMFRLKENWRYLLCLFQVEEKLQKQLRKTTDLHTFQAITGQIIRFAPLRDELAADW